MSGAWDFRAVTQTRGTLCEGPVWLPEQGAFQWVDILEGRLCRWVEATGTIHERRFEPPLGCALPLGNDIVLAFQSDLWLYDWDRDSARLMTTLPVRPGTRLNDGGVAPDGSVWVGSTSSDDGAERGMLFRVTLDGDVQVVLPDVGLSNGIGWLSDGRTVYVDTFAGSVQQSTRAPDGQYEWSTFAVIEQGGVPDGLCVDGDDNVWVALWDGSAVIRLAPDGTASEVHAVPVPRCTSLAFGGANNDLLLMTTASWLMSEDEITAAPLSGHVLIAERR
jgi:sugar lactone lactonase YvrE